MNLSQRPGLILFIGVLLGAFVWLIDVARDGSPAVIVAVPGKVRSPASQPALVIATPGTSAAKTGHATLPPLRVRTNVLGKTTPAAHEALLSTLNPVPIQINGRAQRVLNARAVSEAQYRADMGPVLRKQNGFIIIAVPAPADPSQVIVRDADRPTLLDSANGRIGIVSGTLIIKLKDISQAKAFGARYSLRFLSEDSDISRAYFRVPDGFNLNADSAKILADPEVDDVEIEILRGKVGTR